MTKKQSRVKKPSKNHSRVKQLSTKTKIILIGVIVLLIALFIIVFAAQVRQDLRIRAVGEQTDQTNLSFTANGYTSTYHLYAGGLDWTKAVGLLIYTDGSGEYGLKNPSSTYLMAGATGMIAVAKKHNMILLTPLSPNKACSDGDGSCWYLGDPPGYTKWAESMVASIESQYPIDKKRIAVGGYSSGAQFTSEYWVPSGAAQRTMEDGVIVNISYGGSPKVTEVGYTPAFKSNVPMNWNVGDADPSYTSDGVYGVKAGYDYYTNAGFQTSLDIVPGVAHDRTGQFGAIMDAQITKNIPDATAPIPSTTTPVPSISAPTPSSISPTYVCGGSSNCIPSVSPSPTPAAVSPFPSALPSIATSPLPSTNPSSVPITSAVPTEGVVTQMPSENPANPNPSPEGKKRVGSGNSNQQGLLKLLMQLIQQLLSLFAKLFQ